MAPEDCGGLCWSQGEGVVPLLLPVGKSQGRSSFLTGDGSERPDHGQDGHWPKNFRDR